VSGYVALCRPLPGAVVTWFVTGSGIYFLRSTDSLVMPNPGCGGTIVPRPAVPALERESARLLPMPVKVRPSCRQSGLVEGRYPAHQEVSAWNGLQGVNGEVEHRPARKASLCVDSSPTRSDRMPSPSSIG
jgi:hypothetical protein